MATILADKDIQTLLGVCILNGAPERINPNGLELRLGKYVHFHSTGEEMQLEPGQFLSVSPGETVSIASVESLDFSQEAVEKVFPKRMLMGFVTPTTTMMREGISQVTTKIDAGYRGGLNWSLRNGSTRDVILQFGEPLFKLTLFLLDQNESPSTPYGGRPSDNYQGTDGIVRSTRRIPADIPKSRLVSSSFHKLDPKKQLREAGYPFDHIGTELVNLDGKIEVVSADLRLIKDDFRKTTSELTQKIEKETASLLTRMDQQGDNLLVKVESLFHSKFLWIVSVIIGAIPIMYGALTFLQGSKINDKALAVLAILVGVIIILVAVILTRPAKK